VIGPDMPFLEARRSFSGTTWTWSGHVVKLPFLLRPGSSRCDDVAIHELRTNTGSTLWQERDATITCAHEVFISCFDTSDDNHSPEQGASLPLFTVCLRSTIRQRGWRSGPTPRISIVAIGGITGATIQLADRLE